MHKLFIVFYSIRSIQPRYRYQLRHISTIANYPDEHKHGVAVALNTLLPELNELQSNCIMIKLNRKNMCLKYPDNFWRESLNEPVEGFACSFSHGSVCSFCIAQSSLLSTSTREGFHQVRSRELHESNLSASEIFMSQLIQDIIHDLFEGVFPSVVQHTLKGLLQAGIFSKSDINGLRSSMVAMTGQTDHLSSVSLLQQKGAVKGTASKKWCLLHLLPQILASSVPEESLNWEV